MKQDKHMTWMDMWLMTTIAFCVWLAGTYFDASMMKAHMAPATLPVLVDTHEVAAVDGVCYVDWNRVRNFDEMKTVMGQVRISVQANTQAAATLLPYLYRWTDEEKVKLAEIRRQRAAAQSAEVKTISVKRGK